ncbi:MAG: bifunctional diaminohydroxyphosphoribosylaminopyrimidine deaminase/5-amino-6-(5-phosphoribosylamino)uracil reductase RibD [Burkholderiaceae bacterium]|jgi:diaminohydroxyphosphoribosylaminopyrimidine deaminase/5-amino-6-(5-phosphoribosylamino)uracil reductase|nr:bifunctional diaminohydroxyphosphoribosylaminopyrimidine deaminase/5-amino-6-(5-phosphoribosylamino)uracil reductase RibD [Burkholderiaceae bacterium]
MTAVDHATDLHMRAALDLARRALPLCLPNPAVGCVIVGAGGAVLGSGHTQAVGQAHAEVMALRDAAVRGQPVRGATAYVTLEPCAHQGRTGPCCEALMAAGIGRVVAALQDPNPRVAGQGFARLRAAGIEVAVGMGADEARELNIGFFSRMLRGMPWVRAKAAVSLDGRTALSNGQSQWITSPAARADGHAWRLRAGTVLTGLGTVLRDDPQLNVRLPDVPRQPDLVLLDSRLRTPATARLWGVAGRRVRIYTAVPDAARQRALTERGAEVIALPDERGQVDLRAMLRDLAQREVGEVHVEAGARLNGALLRAGLVDELLLYQAPLLLGEGAPVAALGALTALSDGLRFEWREVQRVGDDLRLLARLPGRGNF